MTKRRNKIQNYIKDNKKEKGITIASLIITIVLNSSYLAMARMNKFEKI